MAGRIPDHYDTDCYPMSDEEREADEAAYWDAVDRAIDEARDREDDPRDW